MNDGPQLPAVGDLLGGGKYRIVRHVGTGGMGAVYEGENLDTTRRVAIKVLRPELTVRADLAKRFVQEARAACRIEHPNIVSVFDLIQEGRMLFIVEEFLDGEDLKQRVERTGPLAPIEALRSLLPVMEALAWAHTRGVVHRDIKPDNIFLSRTARGEVPKIIDFGIARVLDESGESMQGTVLGEIMGTAYYMSPEQARGDVEHIDGRTDIWSIGAVLFNALTGERPFEAANRNQLLYRITHERAPTVISRMPDVPELVNNLVAGAMEPELARRFSTMDAFVHATRACIDALNDRTEVVVCSGIARFAEHDGEVTIRASVMPRAPVEEVAVTDPVRGLAIELPPQPIVAETTRPTWETAAPSTKQVPRAAVWGAGLAACVALFAVARPRSSENEHRPQPRVRAPQTAVAPQVAPTPAPLVVAQPMPEAPPVVAVVVDDVPPARETSNRAQHAPLVRVLPARTRRIPLAPNPYAPPTPQGSARLHDPWAQTSRR